VVDKARRRDRRADPFVEHLEDLQHSLAVANARRDHVAHPDRGRGFGAGTVHSYVSGAT
jgi:hypothetical protein